MDRVGFDEDRVLVRRPQILLLDSKLGGRSDALFSPSMAAAEGLEHSSQQVSRSSAIGRGRSREKKEKGVTELERTPARGGRNGDAPQQAQADVAAEMGQFAAQDVDLVGDELLRTVSICSETARLRRTASIWRSQGRRR